jgi:hypothetical protein
MNNKILVLLAVGILTAPITGNAQITTLDYQGYVMYGSSTYLPTNFVQPINTPNVRLPTTGASGEFTAVLTLSGSLSANNLVLTSYDVNFAGNSFAPGNTGTSFSFGPIVPGPEPLIGLVSVSCLDADACYQLTSAKGAITGATLFFSNTTYHESPVFATIGTSGDSFSYTYATTSGGCANLVPHGPPGNPYYAGPTINPCGLGVSNSKAGVWSVSTKAVPEIDPSSTASGMTLLLGGIAVLRARRKSRH